MVLPQSSQRGSPKRKESKHRRQSHWPLNAHFVLSQVLQRTKSGKKWMGRIKQFHPWYSSLRRNWTVQTWLYFESLREFQGCIHWTIHTSFETIWNLGSPSQWKKSLWSILGKWTKSSQLPKLKWLCEQVASAAPRDDRGRTCFFLHSCAAKVVNLIWNFPSFKPIQTLLSQLIATFHGILGLIA